MVTQYNNKKEIQFLYQKYKELYRNYHIMIDYNNSIGIYPEHKEFIKILDDLYDNFKKILNNKNIEELKININKYNTNDLFVDIDSNNNIIYKELSFEEICRIPLPEQTEDEILLLSTVNISNLVDNNIKLRDENELLKYYEKKYIWEQYKNYVENLYTEYYTEYYNEYYNYKPIYEDIFLTSSKSPKLKKTKLDLKAKPKNKSDDKSLDILSRYPFKQYIFDDKLNENDILKELYEFATMEETFRTKYQSDLYIKMEHINEKYLLDINKIKINDIVEFRLKAEGKPVNDDSKLRLRRKIERSKELYQEHKNRLSKFKFYISHLSRMSDTEWNQWKLAVRNIINTNLGPITEEKCSYIFKKGKNKGKICGIANCNNKQHNIYL